MKKWFFMLICMVAFVLPQNVWAQTANVSGTKLTITTTAPGQVSAAVSGLSAEQKAAITEIVLVGKFDSSDLENIQNSKGFSAVTTVDMSEARFVTVNGGNVETPSSYVMFASEVPTTSTSPSGTHAIVGGQLWHTVYTGGSWTFTSTPGNESDGNGARVLTQDQVSQNQNTEGLSKDAYGKVPAVEKYLQLTAEYQSWGNPSQADPGNATDESAGTQNTTEWEAFLAGILPNYSTGQSIKVVYYFKVEDKSGTNTWVRSTKEVYDASDNSKRFDNPSGVNFSSLLAETDTEHAYGGYFMRIVAYYTKTESGRAWNNETTTPPAEFSLASFDYAYRSNHLNDYAVGTWVKMTDYTYYQLNSTGSYTWAKITPYDEGGTVWTSTRYSTDSELPSSGNTANQWAIVGGTEYISDGSNWSLASSSGEVTDYQQMKFSYWSGSITTAITSKYADSNISSDIFNGCSSIKEVRFLGGHVKGLSGRTPALTTLFIGKDVTEIEAAQVQEVTSLKTLTFDKDYSSYANEAAAKAAGYPKELVISNKAFYGCTYLEKVEIPNRCVSIGASAFEKVGNKDDTNFNGEKDENQKFYLTFERRNKLDQEEGKTVGISCDFPLTIGESAFMDCWYLRDLSLPIRLETMGNNCFKNTIGMKTLEMREVTKAPYDIPAGHHLLSIIPEGAFYDSAVEDVKIPKCVTEIQKGAFGDTEHLKKLVFQDNDEKSTLTIRAEAFTGGTETGRPQLDVYVMINPFDGTNPGRKVICEYHAFNFTQTVGQTNTATSSAYLHFPEEAWDYYQGDWKRGLAFRQDNLNAMKDGYTCTYEDSTPSTPDCIGKSNGTIDPNTGKYETGNNGTQYAPANGWQEFARTSTSIDIIIPAGSFVRTYSTEEPQVIPTFALVANKPSGVQDTDPLFRIYRISQFNDNYIGGESVMPSIRPVATATEITEEYGGRKYIPPHTGVIMVGRETGVAVLVYLSDIEFVSPAKPYTYEYTSEETTIATGDTHGENYNKTNFLFAACDDDEHTTRETTADGVERVILNPTYPYPYHGAQPDYRFFALAKNSSDQYYFSRFKKGGFATRDKAYLKLSKDVFHWSAEGETASGTGSATGLPEPGSTQAPIMMSFMNPEGNTTDVRMINLETMTIMDDCYYTLQGVKISGRPTQQGIYIHNGKKVVIK